LALSERYVAVAEENRQLAITDYRVPQFSDPRRDPCGIKVSDSLVEVPEECILHLEGPPVRKVDDPVVHIGRFHAQGLETKEVA
jgi:hypothetical protein